MAHFILHLADWRLHCDFIFYFRKSKLRTKSCETVKVKSKGISHSFCIYFYFCCESSNKRSPTRNNSTSFVRRQKRSQWLIRYGLLVNGFDDGWRRAMAHNVYREYCVRTVTIWSDRHCARTFAVSTAKQKRNKGPKYCQVNTKLKKKFQTTWMDSDTLETVWQTHFACSSYGRYWHTGAQSRRWNNKNKCIKLPCVVRACNVREYISKWINCRWAAGWGAKGADEMLIVRADNRVF